MDIRSNLSHQKNLSHIYNFDIFSYLLVNVPKCKCQKSIVFMFDMVGMAIKLLSFHLLVTPKIWNSSSKKKVGSQIGSLVPFKT